MLGWLQGIAESLGSLAENIASGITAFFKDPLDSLQNLSQSIVDWTVTVAGDIADGISAFLEDPLAAFENLLQGISDILGALAESIVTPIKEFLEWLFVPDTDLINAKFQEVRSKYGFVDSIIETGEALGGVFSKSTLADQEPPVIYIDFGAAETDYAWGGKMKVLDLSWYARYKPTVDTVLAAIMWGFFVWRVYVRLPSIISGSSGLVRLDSSSGGKDGS